MSDINPIPSGQMPKQFMEQETINFLQGEWNRLIKTGLHDDGEYSILISNDAPWQASVLNHWAFQPKIRAVRQSFASRFAELWKLEVVE